jgi:hypothetical protein
MALGLTQPERPFTCDVCNKGFRKKELLIKHVHVHTC